MHDFLAGFNSPKSVLADQNDLFSVFATDFEKREFCKFLHARRKVLLTTETRVVANSRNTCSARLNSPAKCGKIF